MRLTRFLQGAALTLLLMPGAQATAQVTFDLDAGSRGPKIGGLHYGIFYEEINHAGDGGLYAELVRNRSFEDAHTPESWRKDTGVKWSVITSGLLNSVQNQALQVEFAENTGIRNLGFWGMNCEAGKEYTISFWAKAPEGYNGVIHAAFHNGTDTEYGGVDIPVKANGEWKKYEAKIVPTQSNGSASLKLTSNVAGKLCFDVVSLFPPTYKGRKNGLRIDLAEKLQALKPAFVRFPGGCFIEGTYRDGKQNRFEWKKTIGAIEERPGHYNVNWNYNVTDGLGFHELLQMTEDFGAEPLFVVNIGIGHGWKADYNDIDEYIQEALDAIEYCNGDVSTKYGAMRAANGHPEPFNLRLIEIGNENYQANVNEQSDHYAERYRQFYDAIKAEWPDVICIGNVESWGTDDPSWRNNHPVDAVDEHYYRNPEWFAATYTKYDNYDRRGPKVYAGEYAVTSDFGNNGTLRAALGEAIYMLGMERNSDICVMGSYAPIFVNENDQCWKPDMIRFGSDYSFGTPSYHVQKLFPNNVGTENVLWTEHNNNNRPGSKVGFSTWSTLAEFDNVKVSDVNGTTLYSHDFATAEKWNLPSGWAIENGVLRQTNGTAQGSIAYCDFETPEEFVFEFDATKTSGSEGFLIAFNYGGPEDFIWWNIGGWNNTQHAVEVSRKGAKSSYGTAQGSIQEGHTYHGSITMAGGRLICRLDGETIHDIALPADKKLFVSSNIDEKTGLLYIKAVNYTDSAVDAVFNIANADVVSAESTVLTGGSEAENTKKTPENVVPAAGSVSSNATGVSFTAPGRSLTVLKVKVNNVVRTPGKPMDAAKVADARRQLSGLERRLSMLRAGAKLPIALSDGIEIDWTLAGDADAALSVESTAWASRLVVADGGKGDKAKAAGKLTANLRDNEGNTAAISFDVTLAPADNRAGYLYTHMSSAKEITNYAIGSKEDKGRRFEQLLGGEPVFDPSALCTIEGGSRDAYMQRGERDDQYLMTVTDMCNAKSGIWNNYGLGMLYSGDMVHWEGKSFDFRQGRKIFSDPDATDAVYTTDAEYAKVNRVWAPQFIWDPTANNGEGAYLVYYSVLSSNAGDNHDRIVYSYADRDFKTLTQPRVFYDPGYSVIDADIVYNDYDGLYHLWLKHEGANGSERGIYQLTSPTLTGGTWTQTAHITNEGSELCEGSSTVRRIDEDEWNVYYMRYSGGSAYRVCETDHEGLNVSGSSNLDGNGNFQHGSVMTVTDTEYAMLRDWDKTLTWKKRAESTDSPLFATALQKAADALNQRTVSRLAEAFADAIAEFEKANKEYIKSVVENAKDGEITQLIVNPDFNANSGNGWSGTTFTATSNGVAEHWNKTFDTWQVIEDLPAGYYTLHCSGFYRYGGKEAQTSHADGTEQILASLYLNDKETKFMSLYDESTTFTANPYTYPDNVSQANIAFNTDRFFDGNKIEAYLAQPGSLKLGIRKTQLKENDWTCFDNFRLFYSTESRVKETALDASAPVDVYDAQGICIRRNVLPGEAVNGLPAGIYIVGNKKILVK